MNEAQTPARPVYRAAFYLFVVDVLLLAYIGSQPPTDAMFRIGVGATVVYFAAFFTLPFLSRWEERWLRARGLPPALQALLDSKTEPPPRRARR